VHASVPERERRFVLQPALNKFFKRNEVEYGFNHDGSEEFVMHTFLFFLIL
jgi:hypothetical protein